MRFGVGAAVFLQFLVRAGEDRHGVVCGVEAAKPQTGGSPLPLRSSGTFAAANGGFAALLMGSLGVGAGGCVLGFRAVLFDGQ